MPKLLASELPPGVILGSAHKTAGLYAEVAADGSVASVEYWRDGAVRAVLKVGEHEASLQTIERFAPSDEGADENDSAGFNPWVENVLRDLARQAEGMIVCAFCEKPSTEVAKVIMGPHHGICSECVHLCSEILADGQSPA
jgi:hypothetical protein